MLAQAALTSVAPREVWRIVLLYVLFAGLWIWGSDTVLAWLIRDPDRMSRIGMIKGWLFVAATAVLLFGLIARLVAQVNAALQAAQTHQTELLSTQNRLQATLDALPDLLFEMSADGVIHHHHSSRADLLAAPPERFLGRRMVEFLPAEAAQVCLAALQEAAHSGSSAGQRYALDLPQGRRWFELSVAPIKATSGDERRFVFIVRDVTERKLAEDQLELAGRVFQHTREGILVTDAEARIIDVNEAFSRITGYSREEALGRNPRLLSSGRQGADFYRQMWGELLESDAWSGEIWNRRKSGEVYAEMLTISAVRSPDGSLQHYVALFSDITALKKHQAELEHIAHFDALTGSAQPPAAGRSTGAGADAGHASRQHGGHRLPRPGRLQDGQRPPWSRRGRHPAGGAGDAHARSAAPRRHPGPHRRRRVRGRVDRPGRRSGR
jgi:PAS domain S-box-containing protein